MGVCGTISVLYTAVVGYEETNAAFQSLQIILVLRVFRLLRLLRVLRLIKYFDVLWKMVFGLWSSVPAMLCTIALITITLYIAACFAIEMIAKDRILRSQAETKDIIDTYFSSIDIVMMSFLQFVTVDSISSIYWPLVKHRKMLFFYFALIIVVVSIALMNLVTAHLVEASIMHTKRDKELEKQKLQRLRPDIVKAFAIMDADHDKVLSREEVALCHSKLPPEVLNLVPQEKFLELFDLLDLDDSGQVTEDEFVEGLEQLVVSNVSFKSLQRLRFLTHIRNRQDKCLSELLCIQSRLKSQDRETNSRSWASVRI